MLATLGEESVSVSARCHSQTDTSLMVPSSFPSGTSGTAQVASSTTSGSAVCGWSIATSLGLMLLLQLSSRRLSCTVSEASTVSSVVWGDVSAVTSTLLAVKAAAQVLASPLPQEGGCGLAGTGGDAARPRRCHLRGVDDVMLSLDEDRGLLVSRAAGGCCLSQASPLSDAPTSFGIFVVSDGPSGSACHQRRSMYFSRIHSLTKSIWSLDGMRCNAGFHFANQVSAAFALPPASIARTSVSDQSENAMPLILWPNPRWMPLQVWQINVENAKHMYVGPLSVQSAHLRFAWLLHWKARILWTRDFSPTMPFCVAAFLSAAIEAPPVFC
mmetsp:Transcript_131110/g.261658  ORF Transcript_131110/g.261658 Transcript_131110/m.261658 type:complete len:328 (+) Transcript_131110:1151-2134(+)